MRETLEAVESSDGASRPALGHFDCATDRIEDYEQQEHADDRDAADPAQCFLVKGAPVASGRLFKDRSGAVRDRDAAL
jgi:hypothetical protein